MHKLYGLVAIALFWSTCCFALEGKVVSVHDGDTITVLDNMNTQHKIRLAQIDAPELGQAWGRNSKQALIKRIINQTVTIVVVDTDRYGRTVGTVYLGETDMCREQVASGNAWVYRQYMTDRSLLIDEEKAIADRLGLWSEAKPAPPWEWRRQNR